MMKNNRNTIISIVTVMFLWALCYPLIVLGLDYSPHLTFAALRALIAGVTLLAVGSVLGHQHPKDIKIWIYLLLIGLGATTLGFYGMFHASDFVTPGVATVITNTQPMLTTLLAFFILKESLSRQVKYGISLGFLGVLIIALSSFLNSTNSNIDSSGIQYLLYAVLGVSISNILIKKLSGKVNGLIAMGWQLIFGSIFLWMLALSSENVFDIQWNFKFVSSLLGLAIPGTALAYWLWFQILSKTKLNYANSYSFLVPVFGIIMGMMFYGERINIYSGIGITIIFIGLIFVNSENLKLLSIFKKSKEK